MWCSKENVGDHNLWFPNQIQIYEEEKEGKKVTLFIHSDGSDTSVDVEQPIKLKVHWIQKRRHRTRKILII